MKNKINKFIMKWILNDLDECYWEGLWDSIKNGGLSDSLILDHKLIDEEDYVGRMVWDDFFNDETYKPFFNDLDKVLDKWKHICGDTDGSEMN